MFFYNRTPFHADVFQSYSWSANICGTKKWWLFPPGMYIVYTYLETCVFGFRIISDFTTCNFLFYDKNSTTFKFFASPNFQFCNGKSPVSPKDTHTLSYASKWHSSVLNVYMSHVISLTLNKDYITFHHII